MAKAQVTVADVAREAQVSKTTAASILRNVPGYRAQNDTRDRVRRAAHTLGYQRNALAAALSSGRTHTIGIVLPLPTLRSSSPVSRSYAQDVFVAVFNAASSAGLRITPVPMPEPNLLDMREVGDGRLDGLILVSFPNRETVRQIYDSGLACAEIGSGHGPHLVQPDHEGGMAAAVAHLVDLGHRRIAYWRGALSGNSAGERRLSGFLAAQAAHRLSSSDGPVLASHESVRALFSLPPERRATALCTFNDHSAMMALDMAREAGLRVPEDISLVGFDNNVLAETARPQLTTVDNPLDEQADAAVALLQRQWRNETDAPSRTVIPVHLVVRQSTAPPGEASR